MRLEGRVAIITQGTSEFSLALAVRFSEEGAMVVLTDKNEKILGKKAAELGVVAMVADVTLKSDIKNIVDKITRRFGRIDLFVSNTTFGGLGNSLISEKDRDFSWQSDIMSQMYAAKYVLPQMINRRDGCLVNMVPSDGLRREFHSRMYSTLQHPSLGFSERMATLYSKSGIKISVLCSDMLLTPVHEQTISTRGNAIKMLNLADTVVKGIQEEQFMISLGNRKPDPYHTELSHYRIYNGIRA